MFTQVEENYIKGLISSYKKLGYNYYICHTITENNNDNDIAIYFSKDEIKAITSTTFDISNGIHITIDSSSRNDSGYYLSTGYRSTISDNNYNNILSVNKAEFIYTNATLDYSETSLVLNPDIELNNSSSYIINKINYLLLFVLLITFLYTFIINLLRIRKR